MEAASRPNILFIMTDQQRWDTVGPDGGWVKTPNLDRIAAEGVLFNNCVTTCPVCVPARFSMASGLYPHNMNVFDNVEPGTRKPYVMPPDTPTWMRAIRDSGYRTSLFGKTHFYPQGGDLRDEYLRLHALGIDDCHEIAGPRANAHSTNEMTLDWQAKGLWEIYKDDYAERFANEPTVVRPSPLPVEDYYDSWVGRNAANYLEAYDRDEPWMCWMSFPGPHEPWDTPEPYATMYLPETMPAAVSRPTPPEGAPSGHIYAGNRSFDEDHIRAMRADYAGNVTLIDDCVGRVLDVLEKRGELDRTVIIFTSDHGELNGDYGKVYKACHLDGAVRVPMIVRTPATRQGPLAGTVSDAFVEWFDAGPTAADLAGARLEHMQYARSLVPQLQPGQRAEHRRSVFSQFRGERMLMNRDWKLVVNADNEPYFFIDRVNDPREERNLVANPRYAADVAKMEAALDYLVAARGYRRDISGITDA